MELGIIRVNCETQEDAESAVDDLIKETIPCQDDIVCYPFAVLDTKLGILNVKTMLLDQSSECREYIKLSSVPLLNKYFTNKVYGRAEHYLRQLKEGLKAEPINSLFVRTMARYFDVFANYMGGKPVDVMKDFLADNGSTDFLIGGIAEIDLTAYADKSKLRTYLVYIACDGF